MKNIELHISALNSSATSPGNFVLILQEINTNRQLPIIIGLQEAQSIAIALEQLEPLRPLTHDLFLTTISLLNATLDHVRICGLKDGAYLSLIVIKDVHQVIHEIDSRTSDAIALAVRRKCNIFINDELLTEMAMTDTVQRKIFSGKIEQLDQCSLDELYSKLTSLLEKEDYENASAVRDIISKKEQR